jgi:hypothetical protein
VQVGILEFVPEIPRRRASSIVTVARGYRTVDQLAAEQGTGPIEDASLLRGDFWREEEQAEAFLAAVDRWRAPGSYPQT